MLLYLLLIKKLEGLILACRPKQWTKILLFLQLHFFLFLLHFQYGFLHLFVLFLLFVSSSIYFINDSIDIESDKKHPYKKYRPIASD